MDSQPFRQPHPRGRISPQQAPDLHRNRARSEAALRILRPANAARGDERQAQAQAGDGAQRTQRERERGGPGDGAFHQATVTGGRKTTDEGDRRPVSFLVLRLWLLVTRAETASVPRP